MQFQQITVEDIKQARVAMKAYRAAVRERHSREDEMILRGYREIVRGRRLLNLNEAITAGGPDAIGLPRLAIARADAKTCLCRRTREGALVFAIDRTSFWRSNAAHDRRIDFPPGTLPAAVAAWDQRWHEAQAIVPIVPPMFRPDADLSKYHVLFEAEWKLFPPRDPALLKHVGGYLWAVLAIWDLTEVERTVIGLTRRPRR
jgi:hypothetical protein